MSYPRYQSLMARFFFFSLLLQSCRLSLHAVVEESDPKHPNTTSDDSRDAGASWAVASVAQCSGPSAGPSHRVLSGKSLPSAMQQEVVSPSVVMASSHGHPSALRSTSSGLAIDTAGGSDVLSSFRLLTASSGARILFKKSGRHWQALLQHGLCPDACRYIVPVAGSGDVDEMLSGLQGRDVWASRARVHVMSSPYPPYSPCVYLGKIGLLGGMPGNEDEREAWVQGPSMNFGDHEAYTAVWHIQPGYRCKGFRFNKKEVENANYTIRYAAANARAVLEGLRGIEDARLLEAKLASDCGAVVDLETFEECTQVSFVKCDEYLPQLSFKHAALVVYGSTKERLALHKSKLTLSLEICIARELSSCPAATFRGMQPSLNPLLNAISVSPLRSKYSKKPLSLLAKSPVGDEESLSSLAAASTPVFPPHSPSSGTVSELTQEGVGVLLEKKLTDPAYVLSDSESMALLTHCVSQGVEHAEKISGKDVMMVIGDTSAGKGTFVNCLVGREMALKNQGLKIGGLEKAVSEKSESARSTRDGVMPVSHDETSKALMPRIVLDRNNPVLAYCDFPGFLDDRGAEINIAYAVSVKHVLQKAKCVKVLVLLDYNNLLAERYRSLANMLDVCEQFFGSPANLARYKYALLLGVIQVPPDGVDMGLLKNWLLDHTPPVMRVLFERLFLYDPLHRGGAFFWSHTQCVSNFTALRGIPQSVSNALFKPVLSAGDEQKLISAVEKQCERLCMLFGQEEYAAAGSCWRFLQHLRVIGNVRVDRLLRASQLWLRHVTSRRVSLYKACVAQYAFDEAQRHLATFRNMGKYFDEVDLNLDELARNDSPFKERQDAEYRKGESWMFIETRGDDVAETRPSKHPRKSTQFFLEQAGALDAKLLVAEQAFFRPTHETRLSQQGTACGQSRLVSQAKILDFENQRQDRQQRLQVTPDPVMAFGAKEWRKYFGEVGVAPPLPVDVHAILERPCPFWPEKRVKDTHLLMLIPARVAGQPFTLNLLRRLIKGLKGGGHSTAYRNYASDVQREFGDRSASKSYWVLMTRNLLPGSRNKLYKDQKALVAAHAARTGLPYELPRALEAAAAILSHYIRIGEFLYKDDPLTFTCCREELDGCECPLIVGGYSAEGLSISSNSASNLHNIYGVSCLRKF